MPDFRPFAAWRYPVTADLGRLLSPPYDVLSDRDVEELYDRDPHNITHIDVPAHHDYSRAARLLDEWQEQGVLVSDTTPSLTIYRMEFTDAAGYPRRTVGVLGGLEVVGPGETPRGTTTVLPHERVTAKATTDRLDLTRATGANLSPVWGLSLASGLTDALAEPGEPMGRVETGGVVHSAERITDPDRIAAIQTILAADDVLIADGHHRYGVARIYRDEVRAATGRADTPAEQTLAFVGELVDEQLSIEAIHRLYAGVTPDALRAALATRFDLTPATVAPDTLSQMVERGCLMLVWPDKSAEWLTPKAGAFDEVRALDGLWLETALAGVAATISYQHGFMELLDQVVSGQFTAGILIRPTSIGEIRRTAREHLLMPPKSTFFTPKLLTGWVLRPAGPASDGR